MSATEPVASAAREDQTRGAPCRLLYIHPDMLGLPTRPERNPLWWLSRHLAGDYVAISIVRDPERSRRLYREINESSGRFRFHWLGTFRLPRGLRQLADVAYYLVKGLQLTLRNGRYDVIMAYGPYRTGLCGWILARLTGARLILEIPGNPARSLDFGSGFFKRWKGRLSPALVRFTIRRADHLRLRFPDQLPDLPARFDNRVSVFPNFTAMAEIPPAAPSAERYLLFIGYPWDLKGVDILIRAFNLVWRTHPAVRLRIFGHCPDRSPYEKLRGDNPNIEFNGPVPHDRALELIAGCTAFVLASRTDAMARVLLEAMAARRPIIASAVDGIPYYIRDGATGLLFPVGDVDALARHMDTILSDPAGAEEMAARGHEYALAQLSEEPYVEAFRLMIERTLGIDRSDRVLAPPRPAEVLPA